MKFTIRPSIRGDRKMAKKFLVTFTIRGSVFREVVKGNLRINAINEVRRRGADKITKIEEVKV